MSHVVRRAAAFALPILFLPIAAHAGPRVGTVTSSNSALVAREGKVIPAVANMPLFQGDKLMTRANGSAEVSLGDRSMRLGSSSMMPMNARPAILTMNPGQGFQGGPGFQGDDRFRRDFLRQLAEFRRFIRDFRCRFSGFPHVQQIGWGGLPDGNDNDNDARHGHGHDDCPPVSP